VCDLQVESTPINAWRWRVLWHAVAGVIMVYLVALTLSTGVRVSYPAELLYGESIVLDQARRVASDEPLYPSPLALPLTVTAYPPLYYLLVGTLQRVADDSGYTVGRLVSATATLGSALLLARCVQFVSGRWSAGALSAGLFLTQNLTVLLWASAHRVDPLALCFTLGGLALASAGRVRFAGLALVLAVFTKHSFVAAPLAICIVLWPARRALLTFVGVFAVGVAFSLVLIVVLVDGWFFWHTIVANANPWDFEYFAAQFGAFLQFNALPLCLAASAFALPERSGERLWRAYFALSCVLSLVTVGKLGASSNYWLELSAATAALIGITAARLPTEPRRTAPFGATAFAGLVLAALVMSIPAYQATAYAALAARLADPSATNPPQLTTAALIASEPGEVLTDDPGLALLAGKSIQFEFLIFTLLAAQGVWDERPILDAIRDQRFGLVILTQPLETPPRRPTEAGSTETVRQALQSAYAPADQHGAYYLYRPITGSGRGMVVARPNGDFPDGSRETDY
jgi:hypothetical protein